MCSLASPPHPLDATDERLMPERHSNHRSELKRDRIGRLPLVLGHEVNVPLHQAKAAVDDDPKSPRESMLQLRFSN